MVSVDVKQHFIFIINRLLLLATTPQCDKTHTKKNIGHNFALYEACTQPSTLMKAPHPASTLLIKPLKKLTENQRETIPHPNWVAG